MARNDEMMKPDRLEEALRRLSELLEVKSGADSYELVVGGGAGLILADYVAIATEDVDVIATVHGKTLKEPEWGDPFEETRETVAEEMGLQSEWINKGPSALVEILPEGFIQRIDEEDKEISFSTAITVRPVARYDQIFLKTYASLNMRFDNPKLHKHRNDLSDLKPSVEELARGIHWAINNCGYFPNKIAPLVTDINELSNDLGLYPPDKIQKYYENHLKEE
ncbi:MAG: hypothetical protein ABEK50_14355 [bacterium]